MTTVLIMAGGVGSRFWPESTIERPKQFLKLLNDETMIKLTYNRMKKLVDEKNIFIVTNEKYVDLIKETIPNIESKNIIAEPMSKNTAPCILLSSLYLKNLFGETNIICVASDHYIEKEEEFLNKLKEADEFLNINKNAIVTIGITPTRADTSYGYIKSDVGNIPRKVLKFVEKPNQEKALEYFKDKDYLWNAGIFVFNNISMIKEIEKNLPNTYNALKDLKNENYTFLKENYEKCDKISIDYAVLEKSDSVYTIPASVGWDDIGTWASLERYLGKDANFNVKKGNVQFINSSNNIVYAKNKKIVLADVDNLYFIDTDDLMIIGKKDKINEIVNLKEEIK